MRHAYFLAFFLTIFQAFPSNLASQTPTESIRWMKNIDDAIDFARAQDKKIIIDIYTDWCSWCRLMQKKTYQNPKIAQYMNQKYCAVRLNAWHKKEIWFRGYRYKYVPEFNIHQLAYQLLEGNLKYPTAIIMTKDLEILTPVRGFAEPNEMEKILRFYGEDVYKTKNWAEYKAEYKKNYAPNDTTKKANQN